MLSPYCVDTSTNPHTIRDSTGQAVKGFIHETKFPVGERHHAGGVEIFISGPATFSIYVNNVEYTNVPHC